MRVAITGSLGFLGSHLSELLKQQSVEVISVPGEITDFNNLNNFFSQAGKLNALVHFAGISSVKACEDNPLAAYQINSLGSGMVYDLFSKQNPQGRFIFASTIQLYDLRNLASGSSVNESTKIEPLNLYGRTKLFAETLLTDISKKTDTELLILRLANHVHKSQSAEFLLPSVYRQLLECKKSGSQSIKVGQIDSYRDIGTLQDLLNAFVMVIKAKTLSSRVTAYNISSGIAKKLRDLINELAHQLDIPIDLVIDKTLIRQNDPQWIQISCDAFKKEFGWEPKMGGSVKDVCLSFLAPSIKI